MSVLFIVVRVRVRFYDKRKLPKTFCRRRHSVERTIKVNRQTVNINHTLTRTVLRVTFVSFFFFHAHIVLKGTIPVFRLYIDSVVDLFSLTAIPADHRQHFGERNDR